MPARGKLDFVLAQLASNREAREAWNSLFELLWPRVKATTYRALGGRMELAEDAAQEAFLRLLRYCNFTKFYDSQSFLAYVSKVARNTANDIRREAAWQTVNISDQEHELSRTFPVESAEQRMANRELFTRIRQYLSEEDSMMASLIAEGLRIHEIADRLGLTDNAVSVRWFRLRTRVRNLLKEQGISSEKDL